VVVLLDTSHDLQECSAELGNPVEQLLTPLTRFSRQNQESFFAIDNGAFAGFDRTSFEGLLEREREFKHLCRFVAVPDVVANARRTLEVFHQWKYQLTGWPLGSPVRQTRRTSQQPRETRQRPV
jgi:hypothetical protein